MVDPFPDPIRRFMRAVGPDPTDLQREMAERGREGNFPIIGPEVGGLLTLFARMVDAERAFEFGSGFGYSATWFLRGMAPDGEIVLTEIDADEAAEGREYLERAGDADRATYEVGDALEAVERYDGPFDVVLIDHQKQRYYEAFGKVREKVAPGGIVIADNMMRGAVAFDDVLAGVEGEYRGDDASARGVIEYVEGVRDDPGFTSSVLPVGNGIAVSHRG